MTEQTIPADNMEEIIAEMNDVLSFAGHKSEWQRGYDTATSTFRARLKALLPKPRTLADELREYGDSLAGVSVGDLRRQLILFADRVETLEKERDEAQDMEGRATANLSIQMDRAERLAEDLSEARRRMNEQAAEIARLRARELPDGWRLADHPEHGRVIVTEPTPDYDGYIYYMYSTDAHPEGYDWDCRDAAELTFRDEAPAPEPEGDYITGGLADSKPEGLDPASCGRYRPYLVKINEREARAIRIDDDHRPWLRLGHGNYHSDSQVKVIRPLTCEEMDAR